MSEPTKTILVTGAAGNLGKAITQRLLDAGYLIQATLGPKDHTDFLKHPHLEAAHLNLLHPPSVQEYIKGLDTSNIEALICLVGGYIGGSVENTDPEQIRNMIHLNFESAYNIIHYLIKARVDHLASLQVVLIGSKAAIKPEEGRANVAYGLSKSLLFTLANYLNADTKQTGISASIIVPSTLDTPGTRAAFPDASPSLWVPLDRVADMIEFILSDAGKMIREPVYKLYHHS